jgi:PD-(D/E)XK nuclease superfamily
LDDADLEVGTQHAIVHGRLDVFVSSPMLALVIETKIDSGYGHDQLSKYLRLLDAEFAERPVRALATLTAVAAPWPDPELVFAQQRGITARALLWEELHALLRPVASGDELGARLISEFLEMLSAEGLVPLEPLTQHELGTAWADSWGVIGRYRDFFHACTDAFAERLDARPI